MTPILDAARQCGTKARYTSRLRAKAAMKDARRRWRERAPMKVYECPHCGSYHFGHSAGVDALLSRLGNLAEGDGSVQIVIASALSVT